MDSLQIAIKAYIEEHGSIDIDAYTKLSDLYTTEISNDTKRMALYGRKRDAKNARDEANRLIRDNINSESERERSKNPIQKIKASGKEELSSQQLKRAEQDERDKRSKMYRTARLILQSALSTVKTVLKKCRSDINDDDKFELDNILSVVEQINKWERARKDTMLKPEDFREVREQCLEAIGILKKARGKLEISAAARKEIDASIDKIQNAVKICDNILG